MNITYAPILEESVADKAIRLFNRLVKKPEYKTEEGRVLAIRLAAKKVKTNVRVLQKEMTRRHSIAAYEKKAMEEIVAKEKERERFREGWEENEIASGHAHRDETGEFIDDLADRNGEH